MSVTPPPPSAPSEGAPPSEAPKPTVPPAPPEKKSTESSTEPKAEPEAKVIEVEEPKPLEKKTEAAEGDDPIQFVIDVFTPIMDEPTSKYLAKASKSEKAAVLKYLAATRQVAFKTTEVEAENPKKARTAKESHVSTKSAAPLSYPGRPFETK